MLQKLTLIRHASLDPRLDHHYIGRRDEPLSPAGHLQAERLAQRLVQTGSDIDTLWCSPAKRAQQTAVPISNQLNLPCTMMDELQEVNFGHWEGLTFDQIRARDPQLIQAWAQQEESFCFPNGEAPRDFIQRVEKVARAIRTSRDNHLAIISHGGIIRFLIGQLVGWSTADTVKFTIERGGFATLKLYAGQAVLTGLYNDI